MTTSKSNTESNQNDLKAEEDLNSNHEKITLKTEANSDKTENFYVDSISFKISHEMVLNNRDGKISFDSLFVNNVQPPKIISNETGPERFVFYFFYSNLV
jgi:hypothetical protein